MSYCELVYSPSRKPSRKCSLYLEFMSADDIMVLENALYMRGLYMCEKNELNIILRELAKVYSDVYGEDIVSIILYGSYARGDNNSDSDIDVVAIVKGTRADLQNKLNDVWEVSGDLELEYETILSPTVIPYDEYMKYKEDIPYYRNIEKEGVKISA